MKLLAGEDLPLKGILVIDFGQFLSAPYAALRLADLGARVIKIERPDGGDICRRLYIHKLKIDDVSTTFHAINRNKEGLALNLKDANDLAIAKHLIAKADVMIQNFRPSVISRLGLGYEEVKKINPRIVYGSITGYGETGPWSKKPGQDLLAQARSGLPWLNGSGSTPNAFGLSIADMYAGNHLAQGILTGLVRRAVTGKGCLVEVSLLESLMDLQFEVFTCYLNDGQKLPERSSFNNANPYIGAPYGIYQTKDGYLALAMTPIDKLGELLGCKELEKYKNPASWFDQRDEIKQQIQNILLTEKTQYWLNVLEPADIWCAEVLNWDQLFAHKGFKELNFVQEVKQSSGTVISTTRCPIRIDGALLTSSTGSPSVGEHNAKIIKEFFNQ